MSSASICRMAVRHRGLAGYFFFALSLLLPRFTPFLSRETIHRRHGLLITLRRRV